MDPNKTLEQIRALAKYIGDHDYDALVDLVNSLDSWLSKGGFLPDRWKRPDLSFPAVSPDLRPAFNAAKDHEINHQIAEATCKVCSPENFQHQEPHVPPVLATPAEAFAYRRPAAQLRQATRKVPGCSPENFQHQEPYGPPVPATPPEAFYAQLRQTLHEINQSLHEAEEALHDARTILNIKLPHR